MKKDSELAPCHPKNPLCPPHPLPMLCPCSQSIILHMEDRGSFLKRVIQCLYPAQISKGSPSLFWSMVSQSHVCHTTSQISVLPLPLAQSIPATLVSMPFSNTPKYPLLGTYVTYTCTCHSLYLECSFPRYSYGLLFLLYLSSIVPVTY